MVSIQRLSEKKGAVRSAKQHFAQAPHGEAGVYQNKESLLSVQ
jgi:hypothetical protein